MNFTKQERRLLSFYYIYKDCVDYDIALNKILIPIYFKSENQILDVYISLRHKKWIDGSYQKPTKITTGGILEVETSDDLLKHSILEIINDKKLNEEDLVKQITITSKHLKKISEELYNLNEVDLHDHRFGNSTYALEISPKGKKAYYDGKYLEDKNDFNKPIKIQKWYTSGFVKLFLIPLAVAVIAGILNGCSRETKNTNQSQFIVQFKIIQMIPYL